MQVKIYQPVKTNTQSGKKNRSWLLMPVLPEQTKSNDNLMGWTSSSNTLEQIKLKFKTSEEAVKYAQQQGWNYEVIEPQAAKITKKSYADNFV